MTATWEATLVAFTPNATGLPALVELCGIPWTALAVRTELGGAGLATTSVPVENLEAVGRARLLHLDETPSELWVRRTTGNTTSIVHAGPVTGCSIKGHTLTITSPGLLAYLAAWLRDTDYDGSGYDLPTIVRQIIDQYQAQTYGSFAISTAGLTAGGTTINPFTVAGRDGKFIDAILADLGSRGTGFDLTIDPATRQVQLWTPRKGDDLTGSVVLDQRTIAEPDVSWAVAPGQVGSEVFGTASAAAGPALRTTQSNTTRRAAMGRRYITRQWQNIADQAALDDAAVRALADADNQVLTVAPKLLPVAGFSFGDFDTGDLIAYDYDAGIGRQVTTVRVASITVDVSSGAEQLAVGFV